MAGEVVLPNGITTPGSLSYASRPSPAEIISHAVWQYFRFRSACGGGFPPPCGLNLNRPTRFLEIPAPAASVMLITRRGQSGRRDLLHWQ